MALFFYKEKNKDIRAAAYLRLSIEDGDKAESNSIGNQRELIRDFVAERPELHLVGEYADDGYTGTNFERPGFTQMMEDIKSGKINCIIVKDLSRLGRNYIEMGKYLEQIFPMMGIRFIAINDNYDNANTESSDSDSIVVPFKNLLMIPTAGTFPLRFGASWTLSGARESSSAGMQCTVTAKMNGTKAGWWWMSTQQMLFVLSTAENWKA